MGIGYQERLIIAGLALLLFWGSDIPDLLRLFQIRATRDTSYRRAMARRRPPVSDVSDTTLIVVILLAIVLMCIAIVWIH